MSSELDQQAIEAEADRLAGIFEQVLLWRGPSGSASLTRVGTQSPKG